MLSLAAAAPADDWTPLHAFRHFSTSGSRALPQATVVGLAQDTEGVLWVATLDGLGSFDGRSITPVAPLPGAPAHGVLSALIAGRRGGVYVGGARGVHVYDGRGWTAIASSRAVAALAEAADGSLWMADVEGSLWTLAADGSWQRRTEAGEPVVALASDAHGAVSAATQSRALQLSESGAAPLAGGASLPSRPVALLVTRDGLVWVATVAGTLHWVRPGERSWHEVSIPGWHDGRFRGLAEDRRGRIWVGGLDGRVAFGSAGGSWTVWDSRNGPFGAGVMAILGDREGNVWFGLNGAGLCQWVGEAWSHRRAIGDSSSPGDRLTVFGISRGRRSVLVAAFRDGVLRVEDARVVHYGARQGLTEDARYAVEPEPGTLWVGARLGIFESKRGARFVKVLELPSGFVTGLFRSPVGDWFAATSSDGVYAFEAGRWAPAAAINASLADPHVRGMTWLSNGELWVSTLRGIDVFGGGRHESLSQSRVPAIPESVNAVLELSEREVWAGGVGGIAARRDGRWQRMTEADGLPGHTMYSLAHGRGGEVWVGGSQGLGRWQGGRWTVWDSRDGLIDGECNLNGLLVADDGSVLVGTLASLARFDPKIVPLEPPGLVLVWREAPAAEADGIARLPAHERSLRLRWSAPWLGPRLVEYRTRVAQLGGEWSAPSTEERLGIENLTAGMWDVEVAARVEGASRWSEPLRLQLELTPFWHETLLARAALGLGLVALGGALVRLRVRTLRRHAAELEATVRERTAQLADKVEQLQASEQRALAASHAKSAFLASMSHELRTPLNAVLGFLQLMQRRRDRDAEDHEHLEIIGRSSEHLLGLINQVLSLAKIESGRIALNPTVFDLDELVRSVADMFRARARWKGLAFQVESAGLPRAVHGDEVRLREILINLLGNAFKFTEAGGVTLRVSWADGRASFAIEDTGPGMDPEETEQLFTAFSQTGKGSHEGTGLGLALSREFARLMGGDISVLSAPGRGTRFEVTVRLAAEEPGAAPARAVRDVRRVVGIAPGQRPFRMLVVDDNREGRAILSKLLASVGFAVREAADGAQALEAWRREPPDVIWMDVAMPVMDGLEATRTIRAEEGRRGAARTWIVAVTASAFEHERDAVLEAGCDDFVPKPFRVEDVFGIAAQCLGVRYVYDDAAPKTPAPPHQPLTRERLSVLPEAWRAGFRRAVIEGDTALAGRLISEIAPTDAALAAAIESRLRSYQLDELEEVLGDGPGEPSR